MLAFVKMIFLVRRYGDSRHEDEAKRNPNGHCVDKTGSPGRGFPFCSIIDEGGILIWKILYQVIIYIHVIMVHI